MKKIICFMSVIICMFSLMTAVYAESVNIFVPSETSTTPGSTVAVNIDISGNTGIALGKVRISFDKNVLTPLSVDKKDVLQSVANFQSNIDDPNIDASDLDSVIVSWMNYSSINADGTLATVTFAVSDNASGTSELKLTIEELADAAMNNVTATATSGTVNISDGITDGTDDDKIDVAMSENNIIKTTSTVGGTMNLSVYSSKSNKAAFILCIYDSENYLVATSIKNQELAVGPNTVVFDSVSAAVNKSGTYAAKVYTWNEVEKMIPLTDNPIMIPIQ